MKTKQFNKNGIFWLLYLSYVFIYAARLNLSMASPAMRDQGILTAVELGFIGSAFSVVYSCGRLFNGIIGDRLAPKLLIITGLALTGLANLLIGFLPPYLLILVLWCLNAFGQSMLWSALLRTMTDKPVRATASVAEGCATALQVAGVDGVICAIGSLYMVGDVTAAFQEIFGE